MSFRVAFDLDGVFADLEGALRGLVAASNGTPLSIRPFDPRTETPQLTTAERSRAWRCARRTHNFWETLDPIEPGALQRLHTVASARKWHVVFLTQRASTPGDCAQLQTQRWLDRHGFAHASVLVVPGSRGKLATALNLDFVVDDVARYCLDVKLESQATPCLVWRRDQSQLPPGARRLGIEVFHSMGDCLDYLISRDMTVVKNPGLASRIRHRLGLPPRAPA